MDNKNIEDETIEYKTIEDESGVSSEKKIVISREERRQKDKNQKQKRTNDRKNKESRYNDE